MERLTAQEKRLWCRYGNTHLASCARFCLTIPTLSRLIQPSASVFKNLERKGYVESRKTGIVFEYTPLITMRQYQSAFLEQWVDTYFEGSYKKLLAFMAEDKRLARKEIKEIYDRWIKKERNHRKINLKQASKQAMHHNLYL